MLAFNFSFLFSPLGAGSLGEVVASTLAALPAGSCPSVTGEVRAWPEQEADMGSVLWLARRLVQLRRRTFSGTVGDYEPLLLDGPRWVFRSGPLVVAANLGDHEVALDEPVARGVVTPTSRRDGRTGPERTPGEGLVLAPWEAVVIEEGAALEKGERRG